MTDNILGVQPRLELLDFTPRDDYRYALTLGADQCDDAARQLVEIVNSVLAERAEGSDAPPVRIEDDLALAALFSVRARVRSFLSNSNNWNPPFTDVRLPPPVEEHGVGFTKLVQALYAPLNSMSLSNAWTAHAIVDGEDTLSLDEVAGDYAAVSEGMKTWPEVSEQMLFMKHLPLDMGKLPAMRPVQIGGRDVRGWVGVSYNPELGTRAARRLAEVKLSGHRRKQRDLDTRDASGSILDMPFWQRRQVEARPFA